MFFIKTYPINNGKDFIFKFNQMRNENLKTIKEKDFCLLSRTDGFGSIRRSDFIKSIKNK